jgi:hypothetical protein
MSSCLALVRIGKEMLGRGMKTRSSLLPIPNIPLTIIPLTNSFAVSLNYYEE